MTGATPRPWREMSPYRRYGEDFTRYGVLAGDPVAPSSFVVADMGRGKHAASDAAMIVRAVNAHDALVAACEAALIYPGMPAEFLVQVRAALQLAKGGGS